MENIIPKYFSYFEDTKRKEIEDVYKSLIN